MSMGMDYCFYCQTIAVIAKIANDNTDNHGR